MKDTLRRRAAVGVALVGAGLIAAIPVVAPELHARQAPADETR